MEIIAVDDERLALEGMVESIKIAEPKSQVKGFRYPAEALEYVNGNACDVAFLDIEMAGMNGVELAERLKKINPKINVIFTTGYGCYRDVAFDMHVSGYLVKPITPEKITRELAELRNPVPASKRVRVQAFGNFEVYCDGVPLAFKYAKARELFAYLVDRKGALCSVGEMMAILFEDDKGHETYFKSIRSDLLKTLQTNGCESVLVKSRGMLGIRPDEIDCDYFDFNEGKACGINAYRGEYMAQYSWAEFTHAALEERYRRMNNR